MKVCFKGWFSFHLAIITQFIYTFYLFLVSAFAGGEAAGRSVVWLAHGWWFNMSEMNKTSVYLFFLVVHVIGLKWRIIYFVY